MSPVFVEIISQKLATYRDLQEFYSYGDALDLFEIAVVNSYNEYLMGCDASGR